MIWIKLTCMVPMAMGGLVWSYWHWELPEHGEDSGNFGHTIYHKDHCDPLVGDSWAMDHNLGCKGYNS